MRKLLVALLLALSLLTSPARATEDQVVLDTTVATWNVMDLPAHPSTIASDFRKLAAKRPGIILWQELTPAAPNYVTPLRRSLPGYHHAIARNGDCWYDSPISARYSLSKGSWRLFQVGRPGITGNRYLTRSQALVGNVPVVLRSGHIVASAWGPGGSALRQRMWLAGQRIVQAAVAHDAALPQILGGDWNRASVSILPTAIAGHRVQAVRHGIDWLHFIDGDHYFWRLVGPARTLRGHSDHAALIQRIQLIYRG